MSEWPRIIDRGRAPRLKPPPKACETHSHIYGPPEIYQPHPGRTPHEIASVDEYLKMLNRLGIERAVIVQPSLYSADNRCTLDAIRSIGLERARGVAVTREDVSRAELQRLHDAGIRGMRYFLLVDDLPLDGIQAMARKIADFGWHVQVQDNGSWIRDAMVHLRELPVDVVIDHVGRTPAENGVDDPDFRALLRFAETGRCWVKISAPYLQSRSGPPRYQDVGPRVKALVAARPDRLVWAANWPHPGFAWNAKPDDADCLDVLLDWVPDEAVRHAILADNPARLYDFPD